MSCTPVVQLYHLRPKEGHNAAPKDRTNDKEALSRGFSFSRIPQTIRTGAYRLTSLLYLP